MGKRRNAKPLRRILVLCLATLGPVSLLLMGLDVASGSGGPWRRPGAVHTVCQAGPPACDFTVIQAAVDAAGGGDVIKVAAGRYTEMNTRPAPYDGAMAEQIVFLDKSVILQGGYTTTTDFAGPPDPVAHPTILDGQGRGRLLMIYDASPIIEGFVLTDGDATGQRGTPYGDDAGGAVYIWGGAPVLQSNQILKSSAPQDGGGIYMRMHSAARVWDNSVMGNSASFGGGLYVWSSTPVISDNLFIANRATGHGGAVWMGVYSVAHIQGNDFYRNTADGDLGGAALLLERSQFTFSANRVISNTASNGGGLTVERCEGTLTNNIIAHKQAVGRGGGLWLRGADVLGLHNTMAYNVAQEAGISVDDHWQPRSSHLVLRNTILVRHKTALSVASDSSADLEATLWGSGAWANEQDSVGAGGITTGTINLWADPAFLNPEADDYHLTRNSAALDKGIDVDVRDDIDGERRYMGAGFDLGADELLQVAYHHFLTLLRRDP